MVRPIVKPDIDAVMGVDVVIDNDVNDADGKKEMELPKILSAIQRMKQQLKTSTVMKWTYPVWLHNIPNTVFTRTDTALD